MMNVRKLPVSWYLVFALAMHSLIQSFMLYTRRQVALPTTVQTMQAARRDKDLWAPRSLESFPFRADWYAIDATYDGLAPVRLRFRFPPSTARNDSSFSQEGRLPSILKARPMRSLCGRGGAVTNCLVRGEVTLVLSVWRREMTKQQLENAMTQTVLPAAIIVYQNENFVNVEPIIEEFRAKHPSVRIHHIHSEQNMKYHGRFLLPLGFKTEFTTIWDDDILPGAEWIEICRDTYFKTGGGLIGGNARWIKHLEAPTKPDEVYKVVQGGIGDMCDSPALKKVDFVGHSWFFRTDYAHIFWSQPWLTFETGEDMQIAFLLQQHGVSTYIPKQEKGRTCAHGDMTAKVHNEHASYKAAASAYVRPWLICALLRSGWKVEECDNCKQAQAEKCEESLWERAAQMDAPSTLDRAASAILGTHQPPMGRPERAAEEEAAPQGAGKRPAPAPGQGLEQQGNEEYEEGEMVRMVCILGTRPEAVKMAPLIRELKQRRWAKLKVVLTGQHVDLITPFLLGFNVTVDSVLENLMLSTQPLSWLTGRMLGPLQDVFDVFAPHLVLVQGDTTSALAGALVGFYNQIPVAHVEAGLRTYHLYSPHPEEVNRQLIDMVSSFHFPPTELAASRLIAEGVPAWRVEVTGNTGIDAVIATKALHAARMDHVMHGIQAQLGPIGVLELLTPPTQAPDSVRKVVLLTCHRRENQGEAGRGIFSAVRELAEESERGELREQASGRKVDLHFLYPVHPNSVGAIAREVLGKSPRVRLVNPLDFDQMAYVMERVAMVFTDSGGLQEESTLYQKPVLILRELTDRPEGVHEGVAKLVGASRQAILDASRDLLTDDRPGGSMASMSKLAHPYGNGTASLIITDFLFRHRDQILHQTLPPPGRAEVVDRLPPQHRPRSTR